MPLLLAVFFGILCPRLECLPLRQEGRKQSVFIQKQLHLSLMYLSGFFSSLSCLIGILLKVYISIEFLFLAFVEPPRNLGIGGPHSVCLARNMILCL